MSEFKRVGIIQGNEACAVAAIDAGVRFFAGYPITPSTEIAEMLAAELPKVGGRFIQMEDELGSMAALVGASFAGLKPMTATSGPGFSLMQENLGFAAMVEAPCVVVNVQRGGPSTGLPTKASQGDVMQAKWGSHGNYPIIALAPHTVREVYDATVMAVNFAEEYRTPVVLLLDEVIGHMRERVVLPMPEEIKVVNRKKPSEPPEFYKPYKHTEDYIPPMAIFGEGYRFLTTGLFHDEMGFPTSDDNEITKLVKRLHKKIYAHEEKIWRYEEFMTEDAEYLLIAYGSAARAAKEAVLLTRKEGKKVGLLRILTVWPFPAKIVRELANGKKAVLVCELNYGELVGEVERATKGLNVPVFFKGRWDGELLHPFEIRDFIKGV